MVPQYTASHKHMTKNKNTMKFVRICLDILQHHIDISNYISKNRCQVSVSIYFQQNQTYAYIYQVRIERWIQKRNF